MAISFMTRTIITKPTLTSLFSRSFTSNSLSLVSRSSYVLRLRPIVALAELSRFTSSVGMSQRCFSSRPTKMSLNDPSPNWNNRPPTETILLDGCDFEHWLIVMEKPEGEPTRDEIIDSYIQTLMKVVGSEEEARKSIYSVSTKHYFAFSCIVSEEVSYKIKELPRVRWVLPDSYLDVRNKDYGGEPFIDGQAVPYDPKYHEEWVRNNSRASERSRRNDRPRNFDRSRNFDRRRENMQNRDFQGPNRDATPMMMNSTTQNFDPDMGGSPPNPNPNMGGMPPNSNIQNSPSNMGGGPAYSNSQNARPSMGGMPPHGNPQNNGTNMGGPPPYENRSSGPNMGGPPPYANRPSNAPNVGGLPPYSSQQNNGPMGSMPNRQNDGYPNNMTGNMGGMPNRDSGSNTGPMGSMPNRQNDGYPNNMTGNMGGMPNRDSGPNTGYSNTMPNRDFQPTGGPTSPMNNGGDMPYQSRAAPPPQFNNYNGNRDNGGASMPSGNVYQVRDDGMNNGGNNSYQVRDLPGRDF